MGNLYVPIEETVLVVRQVAVLSTAIGHVVDLAVYQIVVEPNLKVMLDYLLVVFVILLTDVEVQIGFFHKRIR